MTYNSALFEVLGAEDSPSLREGLKRLSESTFDRAVIAEHWIEVLLACHMQGLVMDPDCAERFVGALTARHLGICTGTLYEAFLPNIANRLLGAQIFDETVEQAYEHGAYTPIARSIAFGCIDENWLPPFLICARDACRLLQKVEYISAVHAMCCLVAARHKYTETLYRETLDTFLADARKYLGWSSVAVESPQLKFELKIYDLCKLIGAAKDGSR